MSEPPSMPREPIQSVIPDEEPLPKNYFRLRDFEYAQPLYDFAFLLEVGALVKEEEVRKYRKLGLSRAAYGLDGYGTSIDCWLDGTSTDRDLDSVPSSRIRRYLVNIRKLGSIPELRPYKNQRFARALRLRSVRGLGPKQIALSVLSPDLEEEWLDQIAIKLNLQRDRIAELYGGKKIGPWQTAHVIPPLLRFLRAIEKASKQSLLWNICGVTDPFEPITGLVNVSVSTARNTMSAAIKKAMRHERFFHRERGEATSGIAIAHQMGWGFVVNPNPVEADGLSLTALANLLDPLIRRLPTVVASDLHLHTAWSDGTASVNTMANAIVASGLKYFAVTDHSRSCKLQGGLTPVLWLRQAHALTLAAPVCPVLHGIEVDILKDGTLDLPRSLLVAADLVVASVHSNWTDDARENTNRLFRAIESGCIDILAHPTSAVIGKPGVPDYLRPPAPVNWDEVFAKCATWRVALELNCFPSRLDLPLHLLERAIDAGCAISLGSDAHARTHLINLRFGGEALKRLRDPFVLNSLSYDALHDWLKKSRTSRQHLTGSIKGPVQSELEFGPERRPSRTSIPIKASIQLQSKIPRGSRIVGIDLTAGKKMTGLAVLDNYAVETASLSSDAEILAFIQQHKPAFVSIDCPLGFPGGGNKWNRRAGIVRVAEYDLASMGIPAYPAMIDSMQKLTRRGIRLRRAIEQLRRPPRVIESYPGAAQDILCIPRKQKSLDLLREGLRRLGLHGAGLETRSDDEMDAITSAIVGRYFEAGLFEPMGIPSEAQLIVPKVSPLIFKSNPIICLGGKTCAGKSVVARYLSVFYGFHWLRTRELISELLLEDFALPPANRIFQQLVDPDNITEKNLRDFGALILDSYNQVPLCKKHAEVIARFKGPIVIDSIRSLVEIDELSLRPDPVCVWYVDCSDKIIAGRMLKRNKNGKRADAAPSPVDRTALAIQRRADRNIPNQGSLEDLRWCIDDALFSHIHLRR